MDPADFFVDSTNKLNSYSLQRYYLIMDNVPIHNTLQNDQVSQKNTK